MVLHGPGLYGCHNHPPLVDGAGRLRTTHRVQRGWTADGRRVMDTHVSEWVPQECGHTDSATDPRCRGCRWSD